MMKAKRSNVNMEKLTVMTIAFNGVQILSSLLIALICLLDGNAAAIDDELAENAAAIGAELITDGIL